MKYHSLTTICGTYYAADKGTFVEYDDDHDMWRVQVRGVLVYVPEVDALFSAPLPPA